MTIALMPHNVAWLWFKIPIVLVIPIGIYGMFTLKRANERANEGMVSPPPSFPLSHCPRPSPIPTPNPLTQPHPIGLRTWNHACMQFFTFCIMLSIPLSVFLIIIVFGHALGGYGDSTWHLFHWLAAFGCAFTSCCATGVSLMLCTALSDLRTLSSAPAPVNSGNVVQIVTDEGNSVAIGGVVPANAIVQGQAVASGPWNGPAPPVVSGIEMTDGVVKGTIVEGKAVDL